MLSIYRMHEEAKDPHLGLIFVFSFSPLSGPSTNKHTHHTHALHAFLYILSSTASSPAMIYTFSRRGTVCFQSLSLRPQQQQQQQQQQRHDPHHDPVSQARSGQARLQVFSPPRAGRRPPRGPRPSAARGRRRRPRTPPPPGRAGLDARERANVSIGGMVGKGRIRHQSASRCLRV